MTDPSENQRTSTDTTGKSAGPAWFTSRASYWQDIYGSTGLDAEIYRRRLSTSVRLIDDIELPLPFAALDVGCGAGDLTLALARRGAQVVASDISNEMTRMTRDRIDAAALNEAVIRADAHHLPFASGAFHLVVALGLLPWARSMPSVMAELARVTRKGGWVLVSFDNSFRLFRWLDPKLTPVAQPLRRKVGTILGRKGGGNRLVSPRAARATVESAGLQVLRTTSVGFGPPTFLARPVGPESVALRIDAALSRLAETRDPWLSRLGSHYIVLARR